MTDFVGYMAANEVHDAKSFAHYVQQELGTPFPTHQHLGKLNKLTKQFFKEYENANWFTLVRLVEYCRARKQHPPHAYSVFYQLRYAYSAGYLPELEPGERTNDDLEAKISEALQVETDAQWRQRLLGSTGIAARTRVFEAWDAAHSG